MPIIKQFNQIDVTPEKYVAQCSEVELIETELLIQKRMNRENIDPSRLLETGAQFFMHRSNAGVLFAIKLNNAYMWVQHVPGQKPEWKKQDKTLTKQFQNGQLALEKADALECLQTLFLAIGEEL